MRELNVSFQGGGAKFAQLFGAAAALRELANPPDRRIRINAVAGASAGAVAATLLASGCDLNKLRDKIVKSDLPKYVARNSGSKFLGADTVWWRLPFVMWSMTLLPRNALRRGLEMLLRLADIEPTRTVSSFADPRLFIVVGDVCQQRRMISANEESILDALEDSCAIPVVFRMPGRKRPFIDGGLVDNLPADELLRSRLPGDIVAVSFARRERTLSTPVRYILDSWDAIHNSRVDETKKKLGASNVLELESGIDTLDFRRLAREGFQKIFEDSHRSAKDWLIDWLLRAPVRSAEQLEAVRVNAAEYFDRCIKPITRRGLESNVTVTMALTGTFDQVRQESVVLCEDDRPLLGAKISLQLPEGFVDQDLKVYVEGVAPSLGRIPHLAIPCDQSFEDGMAMLVLFGRPLEKGEVYKVITTRTIPGWMNALRAGRADGLTIFATDDPGQVDKASITLITPRAFRNRLRIVDRPEAAEFRPSPSTAVTVDDEIPGGMFAFRNVSTSDGPIQGIALSYEPI